MRLQRALVSRWCCCQPVEPLIAGVKLGNMNMPNGSPMARRTFIMMVKKSSGDGYIASFSILGLRALQALERRKFVEALFPATESCSIKFEKRAGVSREENQPIQPGRFAGPGIIHDDCQPAFRVRPGPCRLHDGRAAAAPPAQG